MKVQPNCVNRRSYRSTVIASLVLFLMGIAELDGTCHFPQFLQSSTFQGGKKTWSTKTWWLNLRHVPYWEEKQEIYVKNGIIWRHRYVNKDDCPRTKRAYKNSFESCSEKKLVHNRTCISMEGPNTYRVIQYNADRSHRFSCVKFVKRSDNVVQAYEGPTSVTNDSGLCNADGLKLDEWPWIAPGGNKAATICPVSGGFSFRTIRRLTNDDLCESEWRRSTLEIECLRGDGLVFMAPHNSQCNPFLKDGDHKKLLCWAGWKNDDYIFMIASDVGRQPKYCLRFPRVQKGEFSVLVYFSVICPTESSGTAPAGIEYYELRMYRKDPSSCRDDDKEKCQVHSPLSEACTKNQSVYPHCAKACRQCVSTAMENMRQSRCGFDPNLKSNWALYDKIGAHDVSVDTHEVTMSQLTTFHCMTTGSLEGNTVYKTSSLFTNGCAPRYTCLEFARKNNNILQYRIGPSYREEQKIEELCVFKDDPLPLRNSVRSYLMKNLINADTLWSSYCGLEGSIPFNGTINGRHCTGVVSDWDESTCSPRGIMTFRSETCKQLILPMEFQCLGFLHEESLPLTRLLLTRSMDGSHAFNCWVITSFFDQAEWPQPMMYQLPDAQCSLDMEVQKEDYSLSHINIYLNNDSRHKNCKPNDDRYQASRPEMTKSTNVTYIVPNKQSTDQEQVINIQPNPHTADTRTNAPYQPLRGDANRLIAHTSIYISVSLITISACHFLFRGTRR